MSNQTVYTTVYRVQAMGFYIYHILFPIKCHLFHKIQGVSMLYFDIGGN